MKTSVVMCTYNGAQYVKEQLDSILKQTVAVDEIIVCDDNSADDTVKIVEQTLSAACVSHRVEVNEKALGVANNFLKGLKLSSGDYVFTCDQDDIWVNDKVETFLNAAKEKGGDLYFSDGILVDGNAAPKGLRLWQAYAIDYDYLTSKPIMEILLKSPVVTGAAMMVSRRLIDGIREIPQNWLHDEWFAINAALKDSAYPIKKATFYYRQHGKNVVGAKKENFAQRFKRWSAGYKTLDVMRQKQYAKSCDVALVAANTAYATSARAAQLFWQELCGLCSQGFFKRIAVVARLFFNKGYARFYTGIKGLVRDLIATVFFSRKRG